MITNTLTNLLCLLLLCSYQGIASDGNFVKDSSANTYQSLTNTLMISKNGRFKEAVMMSFFSNKKADSSRFTDKSLLYIETDPSALFFKGFTLQLKRSSLLKNKMIIGVGYYRAELPDFWINGSPQNKNKGWSARVRNGIDLLADYHPCSANKGFFAGAGLSLYNFEIERLSTKSHFNSLITSIRMGYMWRPFNNFLYLLPIAAVAYNAKVSGINTIEGESLLIKKWAFVPTINLGFSF